MYFISNENFQAITITPEETEPTVNHEQKQKPNNIHVFHKTLFHNKNNHRPPGPWTMSSKTNNTLSL